MSTNVKFDDYLKEQTKNPRRKALFDAHDLPVRLASASKLDTAGPVEELAQEIADLSEGVERLLKGKLTERALVTLIYDAMAPTYRSKPQIKEVLRAASNLKELYLKKAKTKGEDNGK
jgi:hypothetical protein